MTVPSMPHSFVPRSILNVPETSTDIWIFHFKKTKTELIRQVVDIAIVTEMGRRRESTREGERAREKAREHERRRAIGR